MGIGVWIAGHTLGDTVQELVDWFDHYQDDTKSEGDQKTDPSIVDEDGTSIAKDLMYHSITAVYSWVLFTVIMAGGYYMVYTFGHFYPLSNCPVTDFESSTYTNLKSQIEGLSQGTYQECLTSMEGIFNAIDLDNNGYVDRCEDAKFLMAIGNTEEYALNFTGTTNLPYLQGYCKHMVVDAFDQMEMGDQFWT